MEVIRYQGISPKLGGSQGECPYPILSSPFGGEEDHGDEEEEILSSDFHGSRGGEKVRVSPFASSSF